MSKLLVNNEGLETTEDEDGFGIGEHKTRFWVFRRVGFGSASVRKDEDCGSNLY